GIARAAEKLEHDGPELSGNLRCNAEIDECCFEFGSIVERCRDDAAQPCVVHQQFGIGHAPRQLVELRLGEMLARIDEEGAEPAAYLLLVEAEAFLHVRHDRLKALRSYEIEGNA